MHSCCRQITANFQKLIFISRNTFCKVAPEDIKVTVIGASSGVGQPLCLLLKLNPLITKLAMYDITPYTKGVVTDLSHLNSATVCKAFTKPDQLRDALSGAKLVVLAAGASQTSVEDKPKDLFMANARITYNVVEAAAEHCPAAVIAIISDPIEALVPLACAVLERNGVKDPRKVIGATTINLIRAATFVSEANGSNPLDQYVPVVGGHGKSSIVPLLSQSDPPLKSLDDKVCDKLTKKIREAGLDVLEGKKGHGSATLTVAFATARLIDSILRGFTGEAKVLECAFAKSEINESPYFSVPLVLGKEGISNIIGFSNVSAYEQSLIDKAIPIIQTNVTMAEEFVAKKMELN